MMEGRMTTSIIGVAIGMTVANYVYQAALGPGDWSVAFERSFFQCTALLCVWLTVLAKNAITT
jgi:hypothetical protein